MLKAQRIARKKAKQFGNRRAQEGVDRCWCGAKYWENDRCVSCGAHWTPDLKDRET